MFSHFPEKTDYCINQSILLSPALTVGKKAGKGKQSGYSDRVTDKVNLL